MEVQRIPKRTVSVIEPQKSILVDKEKYHQKRVAAYCRVSTDSEEQLTSYQNQMRVYTEMITANPEWEFAGLYADEGITGTSVEKREDFCRMLQDCRKGKIDRILVKSISRFARNTKDCLAAVRELKELGVSVLFEEQGIDTARVSSEMVTAIMASLAQKGSESISGNVRWGYQKRMQDGTFVPPFLPYGYKTVDKKICIDEQQAEIVRQIFMSYLNGQSMDTISEQLNASQIPLHTNGADRPWRRWIISYILSNEKYTGNSVWQKTYTTTTFPTKQRKNNGERMQYYVENSHPAIIAKDIFDAVQKLMRERNNPITTSHRLDSPFRRRIVCGNCGSPFRLRHDKNQTYWSCKLHSESSNQCSIPQINEKEITNAFCRLYYKLKHNGNPIFAQMLSNLQKIRYSRMLWSEDMISLNKKISDILSQAQFLAQLQQAGGVDPDTFISSNNKLSEQLRRLKQEKARLLDTDSDDLADRTRDLMDVLEDGPDFLDSFDAELFDALVEKIIVDSNERLRFRLKNGLELTEQIERTKR